MHKKILLLFLSFLLLLTGCSENTASTKATDTEQQQKQPELPHTTQENTSSHTDKTTPAAIHTPATENIENEGTDEPTEDPGETLNDILNELHELEELMNGA